MPRAARTSRPGLPLAAVALAVLAACTPSASGPGASSTIVGGRGGGDTLPSDGPQPSVVLLPSAAPATLGPTASIVVPSPAPAGAAIRTLDEFRAAFSFEGSTCTEESIGGGTIRVECSGAGTSSGNRYRVAALTDRADRLVLAFVAIARPQEGGVFDEASAAETFANVAGLVSGDPDHPARDWVRANIADHGANGEVGGYHVRVLRWNRDDPTLGQTFSMGPISVE